MHFSMSSRYFLAVPSSHHSVNCEKDTTNDDDDDGGKWIGKPF
jgi:hypothetical protein